MYFLVNAISCSEYLCNPQWCTQQSWLPFIKWWKMFPSKYFHYSLLGPSKASLPIIFKLPSNYLWCTDILLSFYLFSHPSTHLSSCSRKALKLGTSGFKAQLDHLPAQGPWARYLISLRYFLLLFFFFFVPCSTWSSQIRDHIWATVVTYTTAMTTPDPLTHCARPGNQTSVPALQRRCPLYHNGNSRDTLFTEYRS